MKRSSDCVLQSLKLWKGSWESCGGKLNRRGSWSGSRGMLGLLYKNSLNKGFCSLQNKVGLCLHSFIHTVFIEHLLSAKFLGMAMSQ